MNGVVGRRLRSLLGINESLLKRTSDATYYTLMVGMALVIAVVASIFMANAILYALGPRSWPAAVAGGLVWGGLVLLIDLSVLLPEPYIEPDDEAGGYERHTNRRRTTKVVARVIVAVAIGYLIAEPLMATLFRRDVNAELPTAREAYDTALDEVGDEAAELVEDRMEGRADELAAAEAAYDQQMARVADLTARCAEDPQFCDDLQAARQAAGRQANQVEFLEGSIRRFQTHRAEAIERAQAEFRESNPLDERDFGPTSLGAWERFAKTHELLGRWVWVVSGAIVLIDTMVVSLKLLKGVTDYERELGLDVTRVQDELRDREALMQIEGSRYRPIEEAARARTLHERRMSRYGGGATPVAQSTDATTADPLTAPVGEPPHASAPPGETPPAEVPAAEAAGPVPAAEPEPELILRDCDRATEPASAPVEAAGTNGAPSVGPIPVPGDDALIIDLPDVSYLRGDADPRPAAINDPTPHGPSRKDA